MSAMTTTTRMSVGLPAAVLVTTIIFLLLAAVISQQDEVRLDDDRSVDINITRQIEDRSQQRPEDFQRPVLDQPPPPPPVVTDPTFRPQLSAQVGAMPDFSGADLDIGTGFNPDRDAQPLVRIPPQYPTQCLRSARPLETVLVEFNVTPEGAVVSPQVINTTNPCFSRAAIRAVERWRYQPRIVDGVAQARIGVRTAIDFQTEE